MTIRSKLTIFIIAFLTVIAVFIAGSLLVFEQLNRNFELLKISAEEHTVHEELDASIRNFIKAAQEWAKTGNIKHRKLYRERLGIVYKNFGLLDKAVTEKETLWAIGREFEDVRSITNGIVAKDSPVGDSEILAALKRLEIKEEELFARFDILHIDSLKTVTASIGRGARIKGQVGFYLTALITVSSLAFLLLVLFMRRMIAVPFHDILTATKRIMSGDRSYRISSERHDEFGIIAQGFDTMVEDLQRISNKNEDLYLSTRTQLQKLTALYELAKAITATLDLQELLKRMASEVTVLLNAAGCVIRLREGDRLVIVASYGVDKEAEEKMTLLVSEGLPGKVATEGKPFLIEDMSKMPQEWHVPHLDVQSAMNVPLKTGEIVIGTFALFDKKGHDGILIPFSEDDLSTAEGFASLSAIAIEKAKMFEAEVKREQEALEEKKRLAVLFDSVQGGILTIGRDFTILSGNTYIETWIGRQLDDIIGKSAVEVFHGGKGICPHCVAEVTLWSGETNTITQVSGLNYAELTAYPIKDESGIVKECVVFIQDITDRVLYQEEMLSLYREVAQTKEYLESLIGNTPDAIVTSDLNGIVTSWNQGAEKIYGFSREEVSGKFLPFIPQSLMEAEQHYTERVRRGEIIKDIETVRLRKDGKVIEVNLTLSPIKDAMGEIIGICGISRDISDKKVVEKELIRKNEELSRLFFISSAMRSTLNLKRLLRMILTAVTMGDGLGFNRAVVFLMNDEGTVLRGAMGVGPANYEEAGRIWERLSTEKKKLEEVMQDIESGYAEKSDTFLDRLSLGIEIPLDREGAFSKVVRERTPYNILNVRNEPLSDALIIQHLGTEAYAVVPLISQDRVIGVLWVDNFFNKKQITDEDMKFLSALSNQVAAAIESAKLFEQISFAEAELENIFKSISDMVYFTDADYTIKSVNKSVVEWIGLPEEKIIGRKCHDVFHGKQEPWHNCPHHKTVETKKSYVEEIDDPYLGGSFLSSTSPLFDPSGAFIGTVHIVRDISEIRNIRERLANAERMAALGEVAAKVAHEIRNPLVSVGGFAQRLEKKLDGSLREYASIIVHEVTRLEGILKDILGFVKEIRLSPSSVNLNDLLRDTLALMESEIFERNIMLETDFGDIPDIHIDPDRIKEALLNIFTNALQAVRADGTISIKTMPWNGQVLTEIHDTGGGIAERDLPFIFDPFFTTKLAGTGLGLAITRRIVEEHKGRIEVISRQGEGTTLRVFLPAGKEKG